MLLLELIWNILVLIPKGNEYNQGINMIDVMWKVVEAIIDTRIKTLVTFHDILHVFCASTGTGTASMELNMMQELASIDKDPITNVPGPS